MADGDNVPITTFEEAYEDAPASVLTRTQREYFFGERDLDDGSERALLRRIRQRLLAAYWDYSLLVRAFPDEELEKIQTQSSGKVPPKAALAGFLYITQSEDQLLSEDVHPDLDAEDVDRRAAAMTSDVTQGITQAIAHREGIEADVDVSITVDRQTPLETLAEGDLPELSRKQLDRLLVTGTIGREEYAKAIERKLSRGIGD